MKKSLYIIEFNDGDRTESEWFVGESTGNRFAMAIDHLISITTQDKKTCSSWIKNIYEVDNKLINEVYESRRK